MNGRTQEHEGPARPERHPRRIARERANGSDLVVVVSAMGDTTDELLDLAEIEGGGEGQLHLDDGCWDGAEYGAVSGTRGGTGPVISGSLAAATTESSSSTAGT